MQVANIFDMSNEELYSIGPPILDVEIDENEPFGIGLQDSFKVDYQNPPMALEIDAKMKLPGFDEDSKHSVPEIESMFNKKEDEQKIFENQMASFSTNYIYGDSNDAKLHKLITGVDNLALKMKMNKSQVDALKAKIYESYLMEHLSVSEIRKELNLPQLGVNTGKPDDFRTPDEVLDEGERETGFVRPIPQGAPSATDQPPLVPESAIPPRPVATGAGLTTEDGDRPATPTDGEPNPADELLKRVGEQKNVPEPSDITQKMKDDFVKALKDYPGTSAYMGQELTRTKPGNTIKLPKLAKEMDKAFAGEVSNKDGAIQQIIQLIEGVSPDIKFGQSISMKEARTIRAFVNYAIIQRQFPVFVGGAAQG